MRSYKPSVDGISKKSDEVDSTVSRPQLGSLYDSDTTNVRHKDESAQNNESVEMTAQCNDSKLDGMSEAIGLGDSFQTFHYQENARIIGKYGLKKTQGCVYANYETLMLLGGSANSGIYMVKRKQRINTAKTEHKNWRTSMFDGTKSKDPPGDEIYTLKVLLINTVDDVRPSRIVALFHDIDVFKDIQHPNIVKLFEYYERHDRVYLILEHCGGGNLAGRCPYSESEAAQIVTKVFNAVKYMKDRGIIHTALKLENILFVDNSPKSDIKIADFTDGKAMRERHDAADGGNHAICATAPETFEGEYTGQSDLWSIGVITYIILSRQAPFTGKRTVEQIKRGRYSFDHPVWEKISKSAKDFIRSLLQLDPNTRPTLQHAMKHPWLVKRALPLGFHTHVTAPVTNAEAICMDRVRSASQFKRGALDAISEISSKREIQEICKWCTQFDDTKMGKTTYSEFKLALQAVGYTSQDIEAVFAASKVDCNDWFFFRDFLAATLEVKGRKQEIILIQAFDSKFRDEGAYISEHELSGLLECVGESGSAKDLFLEADWDSDRKILFKEFMLAFNRQTRKYSWDISRNYEYSITAAVNINTLSILREPSKFAGLRKYKKLGIIGGTPVTCIHLVKENDRSGIVQNGKYRREQSNFSKLLDNVFGNDPTHAQSMMIDITTIGQFAMKTFTGTTSEAECKLRSEAQLLSEMNHPNIAIIKDFFEEYGQFYLVMELCIGGNLYSRFPYSEQDAARITYKLLSAVNYLHTRGIIHGAISLETVVFANTSRTSEVKIINFGLSRKYMGHERENLDVADSTIYSASPESFRGVYLRNGDIWSIGVIVYYLLSGSKPFGGKDMKDDIMSGNYDFESNEWSAKARTFIQHLLIVNSSHRPEAKEAIQHPWLRKQTWDGTRVDTDQSQGNGAQGEKIIREAEFKRVTLNALAKALTAEQILALITELSGKQTSMTYPEFMNCLKQQGLNQVVEEVSKESSYFCESGDINAVGFLYAILAARGQVLEDVFIDDFRSNHPEGEAYITTDNLTTMLHKMTPISAVHIFEAANLPLDTERVAFEDFLKIYRKMHMSFVRSKMSQQSKYRLSITAAVSGDPLIDEDKPSPTVYATYELVERLGGDNAVLLGVMAKQPPFLGTTLDSSTGKTSRLTASLSSPLLHSTMSHESEREIERASSLSVMKTSSFTQQGHTNYVLKVFRLCKFDPLISKSVSLQLRHEINQIKQVIHPNIARVLHMSQHFDHIHVVQELCCGGNLGDKLPNKESEIVDIVKNILEGLQSFHDRNLVFRNLNLETVVFADDRKVKLTNYGLSRKIFKNELQLINEDHWETLYASSPESLSGSPTKMSDMWSLGVITFAMLAGHKPFRGQGKDLQRQIESVEFNFSHPVWCKRSKEAQNFVSSLLRREPSKRPDTRRALKHPWLKIVFDENGTLPVFIENDKESKEFNMIHTALVFQRDALNVLSYKYSVAAIQGARALLETVDSDSIAFGDFLQALQKNGISHEDIVKIFHRVNVSDLVCIDYIGILDKAIKARGYIVEVRLAEAFDAMDISNRGYVTKDEILAMLVSADYTLNVDNIFESIVDDGRITYHEFLRFFDNEIEGLSDEKVRTSQTRGFNQRRTTLVQRLSSRRFLPKNSDGTMELKSLGGIRTTSSNQFRRETLESLRRSLSTRNNATKAH